MSSRGSLALAALAAALASCGASPPPSDAGRLDARARPDAAEDGTKDATDAPSAADALPPPPEPYTCMPCLHDLECGPEGRCASPDGGGIHFRQCLLACASPGRACDAPVPATCRTQSGRNVCVPTASCVRARQGSDCPAAGCAGRYSVCGDDGRGVRSCLAPCTRDSDCENGFRRCRAVRLPDGGRARACVPDDAIGPDACGVAEVNARRVGAACRTDSPCPAGLECMAGLDPALRAFCTLPCATDGDCGPGAACMELRGRPRRCVPTACACAAGPRDTLLDRALAQGSWTRCNLFFTQRNLGLFPLDTSRDRFRLQVFDRVHRDWAEGTRWARTMGPALDRRVSSLSTGLAAAAGLLDDGAVEGHPAGRALPPPTGATPLVDATMQLSEAFGNSADRAAIARDAEDVPLELQRVMARVLAAVLAAAQARDRGLLVPDARDHLWAAAPHLVLNTLSRERLDPADPVDLGALLGDVTLPTAEALDLAATVEAIDWAPFRGMVGPSFDVDTPIGRVVLRGGGADSYAAAAFERTALVLDLGGDDVYLAPVAANATPDNSVSVLIDLAGNDQYGYAPARDPSDAPELLPSDADGRFRPAAGQGGPFSLSETPRQGGARLGVALLYDLGGGRDRYRSLRMSQGFGALGVGGLFDDGGDDEYALEAGGQGAGVAGLGVLVDAGGDDRYAAWAFAQGFAYVRGTGLLYDRDGTDRYTGHVQPMLYQSPQDRNVNSSFTQGAGFGRRGDAFRDGTNMSGGIGVLRDRAGDDVYVTSIFGQGTGYWGGMGLLLDGAGDDRYDGRWYVQGGIAHFAYGALVDGGGRDIHNAMATRQNMTAGAGHDFSLGILLALGADADQYNVPNLALGAGNDNGAGIFLEEGGDDVYTASSALALGNAALDPNSGAGRMARPTVGLFLDLDGRDTYTRMPGMPAANDAVWIQRIHMDAPAELGFGADGTRATTGW